jgi:signal transduction histidine kinase
MRLQTGSVISLCGLIITVVLVLSMAFYRQFAKALDERVLLQLTSIKNLKRIQIEEYLVKEWEDFLLSEVPEKPSETEFDIPPNLTPSDGIYDVSSRNPAGLLSICLVRHVNGQRDIRVVEHNRIQEILLERTGMGSTGETYLVGEDFRLRSSSRFLTDRSPYSIEAKTEGVLKALKGSNGIGIFDDYRGVDVYSAYELFSIDQLKLVILSEIDVSEATIPLVEMRKELIHITILCLLVGILLSLYLIRKITDPLIEMRDYLRTMSKGNYVIPIHRDEAPDEIEEMYQALSELQNALSGAVAFSADIGEMRLDSDYKPKSKDDLLGHSLIRMRDQLQSFRKREEKNIQNTKRLLIDRLEVERNRLSRDLHDGIGPLLTSLKLYVENNVIQQEQKDEIKVFLDETIREIRLMSYALLPPTIKDFGVGPTLTNYVQNLARSSSLEFTFEDLTKGRNTNTSLDLEINLFRICQELLNNTIKHAEATSIHFSLTEFDDHFALFYMDDGKGFNPEEISPGAGISNIKERVAAFSGQMVLSSSAGETTYEIEIPRS